MKRLISSMLALMVSASILAIIAPGEYYIRNDYFDKLLCLNAENGIYLMPYSDSNDAAYIFEAESSGDASYVKLRHKATGKYLAASTSDTWSVQMLDDGNGDQCLWQLDARFSTSIVSKRSTGKRLGCDYSTSADVPIYYDKRAGALNWFTIIPANGSGWESSLCAYKTERYTNEYGVTEEDAHRVNSSIDVSDEDFHIVGAQPFDDGGSVNLQGEKAWLVFENVRPSKVISDYLGNVTINGTMAVNGVNCRVEIWLTGAAVIPCSPDDTPFVGYSSKSCGGDNLALKAVNNTSLGDFNNAIRSFTLKRGYMATVASGQDGEGYSRVYVADHSDLTIDLPKALDRRVSSVHIRKWHYTSKRGYADGGTNQNLACNSSWRWNWDANLSTSADLEYIPIKQHRYWPSNESINKEGSTAMMLINEPEHSEQHTSSKCSCGGTTDEWTAYKITTQFNYNGMRIGSPSATDFGWLKNYTDHCNNMAQRCDFVCTHGYWSSNWANNINTLWNNSKRPIWITEWEYGSSWDSYQPKNEEEYAKHVLDVLDILEYDNRVERYSYYGGDGGGGTGWMRWLFYETNPSKGCTHTGNVYKKVKTHFAYDAATQAVPNWWEPEVQVPVVNSCTRLPEGDYVFNITNGNGDATESVALQAWTGDAWVDIMTETQRSLFESSTLTLTVAQSELTGFEKIRCAVTNIYGKSALSQELIIQYREMDELQNLTFDSGDFIEHTVKTYAKDISNEAPLAQMQPVEGWQIVANGDARASGMYAWGSNAGLGDAEYTMPATNSDGTTDGGALGIVAVWTNAAQYIQKVVLPAGTWTIVVPVYNIGNGTSFDKNLIGFVAELSGREYLATRTSYPAGEWTVETIELELDEDTQGYLSLGYKAHDIGSAKSPHLAIDYVAITGTPKGENPEVGISRNGIDTSGKSASSTMFNTAGQAIDTPAHGVYIIKTGKTAKKVIAK